VNEIIPPPDEEPGQAGPAVVDRLIELMAPEGQTSAAVNEISLPNGERAIQVSFGSFPTLQAVVMPVRLAIWLGSEMARIAQEAARKGPGIIVANGHVPPPQGQGR
jgi:hypothetical protein